MCSVTSVVSSSATPWTVAHQAPLSVRILQARICSGLPFPSPGIEAGKAYSLKEAAQLVKEITFTKFDASLDIDVRLGVDPRKANQMVRGVVSLPHGTGKQVRVLVLCTPDAETAAKEAGADYVGDEHSILC